MPDETGVVIHIPLVNYSRASRNIRWHRQRCPLRWRYWYIGRWIPERLIRGSMKFVKSNPERIRISSL